MPARDPLAVLARVRRLETDQARRHLAERLARGAAAAARLEAADRAIAAEAACAAQPADYAAWLVRGRADRARAAGLLALEREAEETARQALAAARAASRAVELLAEDRAREAARTEARRVQARLDDHVAARR